MEKMPDPATLASTAEVEAIAIRKAFRRLIPWCMVFYVLAYVDRINIGFAALTMNPALGLTATTFGMAGTAFYIAYSLFEVPSNLGMARYGARFWISRIMFTWGLASIATMFAVGPYSLAILRALVGAAEAGLLPGIMLYLGQWFPHAHRARANALFFMSLPTAMLIGAPLSGLILQMDGTFGLAGWRWLFLLEGLPSVAMGIAAYFILSDGPAQAKWLAPQERDALIRRLEQDYHATAPVEQPAAPWRDYINPALILLSVIYFCLINTTSTFSVWTPLIVQDLLGGDPPTLLVSVVSAIPPLFAIVAMFLWTRRADRTDLRFRYVVFAFMASAAGWASIALFTTPLLQLVGLVLCFAGAYTVLPLFWATVAELIPRRNHAVGIALVSTVGTLASIVSPTLTGILKDQTRSFTAGAWFATALLVVAIGLMMVLRRRSAGTV